jgi:hypothetical protein
MLLRCRVAQSGSSAGPVLVPKYWSQCRSSTSPSAGLRRPVPFSAAPRCISNCLALLEQPSSLPTVVPSSSPVVDPVLHCAGPVRPAVAQVHLQCRYWCCSGVLPSAGPRWVSQCCPLCVARASPSAGPECWSRADSSTGPQCWSSGSQFHSQRSWCISAVCSGATPSSGQNSLPRLCTELVASSG